MKPNVLFLATLALADASPRAVPFVEFGHAFREQSSASLAKAAKKLAYQDGEAVKSTKRAAKLFKSKSGGEHPDRPSAETIVISARPIRGSGKPKSIPKSSKHVKSLGNTWSKAAKSVQSGDSSMSYSLHTLSSSKSSKSASWNEFEPRGTDSSMSYALSADQLSMNYLSMNFDESPSFASKSSKKGDSSMSLVYVKDVMEEDSYDGSNGVAESTSISPPPQVGQPEEESAIRKDVFGKIIFEYLSQCSSVPLPEAACLVDQTIYAFMNTGEPGRFRRLKNSHVRRLPAGHFLRQSETTSASSTCHPGEIGDDDIDGVMASSKDTCVELGFDVSDGDVQATRESFAQLFASDECWDALCGEESDPSALFFKILFNEAAACANVQMNLPECVMETVFDLVFQTDSPAARRALQECTEPTHDELNFFVSFLLIEAQATCPVETSATVNWEQASSDLVAVFGASACWGVECDKDEPANSMTALSGEPAGEDQGFLVPTADGSICVFGDVSSRELDLAFYYKVEFDQLDLENIESLMVKTICESDNRRRLDSDDSYAISVVAVDSAPKDVISTEHTCEPENSSASYCLIVEGKATLYVDDDEGNLPDREIFNFAYEALGAIFLAMELPEGVFSINYLGNAPPAQSVDSETIRPTIVSKAKAQDGKDTYAGLAIGMAGLVASLAMLVAGFRQLKKKEQNDPEFPDKADDNTEDLTYSHSCDRGEQVLPPGELPPGYIMPGAELVPKTSPETETPKHFILGEDPETNAAWRDLAIIPNVNPLPNVYEEEIDCDDEKSV